MAPFTLNSNESWVEENVRLPRVCSCYGFNDTELLERVIIS